MKEQCNKSTLSNALKEIVALRLLKFTQQSKWITRRGRNVDTAVGIGTP